MTNSSLKTDAKLLNSTIIVSSMTLISRIFGMLRDIIFARFFGVSVIMDAFIVANRIPNMLRRFFGEGAFNQGFVPVISSYKENKNHKEVKVLVDSVAGTLGLILFIVSLIGVIFSPIFISIVAPGFIGEDGRFDLSALMLKFTFPYLMFISLTAFSGSLLNTYGKFAVPAITPVILNIVLIIFVVVISPKLNEPGMSLAYGVFFAGLIQLFFQLPFLSKINLIPRPRWNYHHEGIKRITNLMGPALFGSSVSQVNILVSGIIASLIGTGKISLLYYSDRIMELPLSLFGIAIATVTLPYLSRLYSRNLIDKFSDALYWSIKIALIFIIPASVGIFILAEPIIAVIYFGGAFDQIDVRLTSLSLSIFSIGLIGFSFVKILSPAYFAREDTKTPVKIGIICVAINLILGSGFVFYLQKINFEATHVGLASSISIAALMNAGLLFLGLKRNKILNNFKTSKIFFIKLCLANIVMLAFLVYTKQSLIWWLAMHAMERAIWLLMIILASMFLYFVTLSILGIKIKELKFERE